MLQAKTRRDALDAAIGEIATEPPFAEVVGRLVCLRGVSTLTALALTVELGDWQRFRPQSLGPFLGLTPSAVDDATRLAYVEVLDDEKGTMAEQGRRIVVASKLGHIRGNPEIRDAPNRLPLDRDHVRAT